jgi:hypothetical protein
MKGLRYRAVGRPERASGLSGEGKVLSCRELNPVCLPHSLVTVMTELYWLISLPMCKFVVYLIEWFVTYFVGRLVAASVTGWCRTRRPMH